MAISADHAITRGRACTDLTGAIANRHAQRLRAEVDAIGVGVGTVLIDDLSDGARRLPQPSADPRRVRPHARTPPSARLFSTLDAGPVIILAGADAPASRKRDLEEHGAEIEVVSEPSMAAALRRLANGSSSLLLEGRQPAPRRLGRGTGGLGAHLHDAAHVRDGARSRHARSCRLLTGPRAFVNRREEWLGPDRLVEGICSPASLRIGEVISSAPSASGVRLRIAALFAHELTLGRASRGTVSA